METIHFRLYKQPKGTFVNFTTPDNAMAFCGIGFYGPRFKAAEKSFRSALAMASRRGYVFTEAEISEALTRLKEAC